MIAYGYWVSMGVVEEKSSRVVEVLLSKLRPAQLMAGKILGIGLLSLVQLLLFGVVGLGVALLTGTVDLPGAAVGTIAIVLGWFVLGFALFAAAGALASRQEEVQNTASPMTFVLIASFVLAVQTLPNPDGLPAVIGSLVPLVAPLIMPVRIAAAEAAAWEIALSVALMVASITLLIPLTGRLYTGAILQTHKQTKLREAWRAARA